MSIFNILFIVNYSLSAFAVLGMVFFEHKKPIRITAWTLTLTIFPFVGLILYILIGYGLGTKTKRMLKKRALYNEKYEIHLIKQLEKFQQLGEKDNIEFTRKDLILLNINNSGSIFSKHNKVDYFSSGTDMIEALKQDLLSAKKTINILFYIFANDSTGREIKNILTKKAKEGVKVKVLYDSVGSLFTSKSNFRKLIKAGGEVSIFFPPFMGIKLFNLKANYRNHRKIVVIDGEVGYTGGMNIRNDHMGKKKRLSPWRDCHIRIKGQSVHSLQNIFLSDWRISCRKNPPVDAFMGEEYYPNIVNEGNTSLQIVASGPTEDDDENIKEFMIKMIVTAKKLVRIQTPYFIPDEGFLSAVKLAILSGVDVEIMIPKMPDKRMVYYATLGHINEVQKLGAKVYLYHGFMHSKIICVDDDLVTVGSCNIDIRSFSLNFELNALLFGERDNEICQNIFENDLKECDAIDGEFFKKMKLYKKFLISICRLFSAIL